MARLAGPMSRAREDLSSSRRRPTSPFGIATHTVALFLASFLVLIASASGHGRADLVGMAASAQSSPSGNVVQSSNIQQTSFNESPTLSSASAQNHTPATIPWPLINQGDRGHPVPTLQYLLRAHGYSLTVDGIFGPRTEAAVRAFQHTMGLTVDGLVGPKTWEAINVLVRLGSRGDAVRAVQYELQFRNDLIGDSDRLNIDGIFGPMTDLAVSSFQYSISIDYDGIVGPITWRALIGGILADLPADAAPLQLTSVCADTTPTTLTWQVVNPNSFAVSFIWDIYETGQAGRDILPPKTTALFTSKRTEGENTARVFVDGQSLVVTPSCLPQQQPDPLEPTVLKSDVEEVAKIIYDLLEAGQDLQWALSEVFEVFGVPTLRAEEDADRIVAAVEAREPIVLDIQLDALNEAFKARTNIDLKSAFDQFAELGVEERDGRYLSPISHGSFTPKIAPIMRKDQLTAGEALPALVLALGQERAQRTGHGGLEPTWGDAQLDPLQFALLTYMFTFVPVGQSNVPQSGRNKSLGTQSPPTSGSNTSPPRIPGAVKKVLNKIAGTVLKAALLKVLGLIIGVALSTGDAVKESLCVPILLNYRMTLTASHTLLYRRWPDEPNRHPWRGTYSFSAVYGNPTRGETILRLLGCGADKRPPNGKVIDKPVSWTVEDVPGPYGSVTQHGELESQERTDQNGDARASFTAHDEFTPREFRTQEYQRVAHGVISARVTDLLEKWETVELILRYINEPAAGAQRLDVIYYAKNRYRMTYQITDHEISEEWGLIIHERRRGAFRGIIETSEKFEGLDYGLVYGKLYGTASGSKSGGCANTESWGPTKEYPIDVSGIWESHPPEGDYADVDLSRTSPLPYTTIHTCSGGAYVGRVGSPLRGGTYKLPTAEERETRTESGALDNREVVVLELLDDQQP